MDVKCRLLTPLHIGGAESAVQPMSFVIMDRRVYVINEQKWSRELAEENLIEDFVHSLPQEGTRFSLRDYLKNRNLLNPAFVQRIADYSCAVEEDFRFDFRPFIRNGYAQPYVPGTSIKGCWRTAVTYCILKDLSESKRKQILDGAVRRVMSQIPTGRTANSRPKNSVFEREEEDLFQSFTLPDCRRSIHTDFFRVIRMSDSPPFDKNACSVRNVNVFSVLSSESPKKYPIRVECLPAGTVFSFSWKIDETLLQVFRRSNHNAEHPWGITFDKFVKKALKPIECAREMAQDVIAEENDFYRKYFHEPYPLDETPDMHLGWGGSLLSTSVSLLLPADLRIEMRNRIFRDRGKAPAPKSRKRLQKNPQSGAPLGWIKID